MSRTSRVISAVVPPRAAEMVVVLASLGRAMVGKVQQLIASGQQLVTAAPASITNPKTAMHLDLIVKGLTDSVQLVLQTGELLAGTVQGLAGF